MGRTLRIGTAPLTMILRGYVLSVLWAWFVVPLGLPPLNIPQALGISVTVGMLTHQEHRSPERSLGASVAMAFFGPLMFLLVGWLIKIFL